MPGCTPKPHQPTVTFAETSGSLLESSDEEEKEGVNEALPHTAAARSSCSFSPVHFESTHHQSGEKSQGCYRCGKGGGFWGRDHRSVETLEAEAAALTLGPAAAAAFGSDFLIPLGLFAWFVKRWVVPFANWVPLAAAIWAIIQYGIGRFKRRIAVEDLNKRWKHRMLNTTL